MEWVFRQPHYLFCSAVMWSNWSKRQLDKLRVRLHLETVVIFHDLVVIILLRTEEVVKTSKFNHSPFYKSQATVQQL